MKKAFLLFIIILAAMQLHSEIISLEYNESTQGVEYTLSHSISIDGSEIQILTPDEQHHFQLDSAHSVLLWNVHDIETGQIKTVERRGNRIHIDGEEEVTLSEELPWYQTLHCLAEHMRNRERRVNFYIASMNFHEELSEGEGLQFMEFKAVFQEEVTLNLQGEEIPVFSYIITFADMRSLFWKSRAWFRISDGRLVQYSEVRGGPGTPETLGSLSEERIY